MSTKSFSLPWLLALSLLACVGCAYSNVNVDDDDHPVFNTGVGARIMLPGESSAMPPAHPGYQLPGGVPVPGQVGARGPQGQPLPAPSPAPSGSIGGAPTSTVHRGPGSTTSSSGGGGITFIGGSEIDEDTRTEIREEPKWLKYLLAPFAIAAYPFTATWNAITRDDGVVSINRDQCVSCMKCVEACPFGAMYAHEDCEQPIKCDMCGGEPECVRNCPLGALRLLPEHALGETKRLTNVLSYTQMREIEFYEKGEKKTIRYSEIGKEEL